MSRVAVGMVIEKPAMTSKSAIAVRIRKTELAATLAHDELDHIGDQDEGREHMVGDRFVGAITPFLDT